MLFSFEDEAVSVVDEAVEDGVAMVDRR